MRKFALFLLAMAFISMQVVNAQVRRINGTVTSSADGSTIPGVSVVVKGTSIGTITNLDGSYQLDVPQDATTITFSFVGMRTLDMPITGNTVNAILDADIIGVDEVLVVAYGTVRKESFTGSASTVSSEKLEKLQTSSISKALQGMAAGVQVTSGLGQPGENAAIRIRGISTFGDASPLIVVDGFPYQGNLNTIPTNDIGSMTILKDASATALYGSRAANGVIIITTKKGAEGTSKLEVKANYGLSDRAFPDYERVNVPQWYELMWETMRNTRVTQGKTPEVAAQEASSGLIAYVGGYNAYNVPNNQVVGTDGKINPKGTLLWNDDWQEEAFGVGKRKDITVNASGGNDKTNYFASATFLNEKGVVKASDFNRYSARLNLTSQVKDWITVGMNLSGSLSDQNFPTSSGSSYVNQFMWTRMIAPIYPVYLYDLQGKIQLDANGNKLYDFGNEYGRARAYSSNSNPIGVVELDTRMYRRDNGTARSFVDFKIMEGLMLKISGSADLYTLSGITHQNQKYGDAANFKGRSTRDAQRTMTFSSNQLLTYDKQFGMHSINVLAGHESYKYKFNYLDAVRTGFPFPGLIELAAASTAEGSNSYEHNHRIESYLSKVDYDFMDKYYISANFRTDGNSIFSEDVRWGNFWGVGMSWRITEENFMQDLTWLNTLRIKASYGEQGSDKIGSYYAYQGLYATGWNNLNYPGLIASRLPTPELTWESLTSTNLGIDIKVFNRLGINFEYYIRNNNDLLFAKPLPPSTGFTSIDDNIAKLQNKGFDLELNAEVIRNRNITWNLDLNLGHVQNTIKELPDEFIISGNKRWEVGKSIYEFWIQDYAGVNPDNGKSQWYKDELVTVDGKIQYEEDGTPKKTGNRLTTEVYSEATRYYSGDAIPDLIGGITNSFRFFDFDLSVFMNFGIGGKIYDGSYGTLMHAGGRAGDNWHIDILDRWTAPGQVTNVPALNGDQNASAQSTRFLVDADFLSIRNVTLGYNVPNVLTNKIKLDGVKVYATVDNLKIFTKRQGIDPQQSLTGNLGNNYTPIRTLSFGLNINF